MANSSYDKDPKTNISLRPHKVRKRGKTVKEFEYRIRIQDPITRKYKERSKRGFETQREARYAAKAHERELIAEIQKGSYTTGPSSLKSHLQFWLNEYIKGDIEENTFILHESNIKNHILPYFQEIMLDDITPVLYQKFLNHLATKTYSTLSDEKYYSFRTNQIIHSTMNNALNYAVTIHKIEKNPCTSGKVKSNVQNEDEDLCYIETENIQKFLDTALLDKYIYYIFFKTLILTGMRKGEAAALKWSDIDFIHNSININKSLNFQPKEEGKLFGKTKTKSSKREIDVNKELLKELKQIRIIQSKQKLKLGDTYNQYDLIFTREDGNFLPKSTLFNAFKRILKKAEIDYIPIHGLRHTHAVTQLEAGIDPKVIQERLGHESVTMTLDIYSHISEKLKKEKTNQYDDYMERYLK